MKQYIDYKDHFENILLDENFYERFRIIFIDCETKQELKEYENLSNDFLYFLILSLYFGIANFQYKKILLKKISMNEKNKYIKRLTILEKNLKDVHRMIDKDEYILDAPLFLDFENIGNKKPKIEKEKIFQYKDDTYLLLEHIEKMKEYAKNNMPMMIEYKEFLEFHGRKLHDESTIRNLIIKYMFAITTLCFSKECITEDKKYWYELLCHICPISMQIYMKNDFDKYVNQIKDKDIDYYQLFYDMDMVMPYTPSNYEELSRYGNRSIDDNDVKYMGKFIFENPFYSIFDNLRIDWL